MTSGGDGLGQVCGCRAVSPSRGLPEAVLSFASSGDGKKLFTVRATSCAHLGHDKQANGEAIRRAHRAVTAVRGQCELAVLASGEADNTMRVWNQATAKESDIVLAHGGPVSALGINAAGTQLLSASRGRRRQAMGVPRSRRGLTHPTRSRAWC